MPRCEVARLVTYLFDAFRLSVPERELWRGEALIPIEPKVFDLLAYLVAHRERAVGRDELIAAVWGRADLSDGTLAQAVLRLRRTLDDNGAAPRFVRTLPRHGYRWIAPTCEAVAPHLAAPARADPAPLAASPSATPVGTPSDAAAPARRRRGSRSVALGLVAVLALAVWSAQRALTPAATPAELLRSGRAAQARAALDAARLRAPDSPELALLRAQARCALDEPCLPELDALLQGALPPPLRLRALQVRAAEAIDRRQFAAARRDLDAADGLDAGAARTAVLRARLALAERRNDSARELAQRASTLAESSGDAEATGDSADVLGIAAGREGRGNEALSHFDAAATAFTRSGDLSRLAQVQAIRSHTLGHLGRFEEALAAADAAVRTAARQEVPAATRDALDSLAWAQLQLGRIADARETVHQALREGHVARHPEQEFQLTSLFGFIEAAGGRFREAIDAWDAALRLDAAADAAASSVGLHLAVLYAALNAGDATRARSEGERIGTLAQAMPALDQYARHAEALLAGAEGDWARAARLFRSVWEMARGSGTRNQQMMADYAEALFQTGDLASVEALLGEASLPSKDGYLYLLVQARCLARRGQAAQAQQAFDRARTLMGERYSAQLESARGDIAAAQAAAAPSR